MINEFIRQFTDKELTGITKIKNDFFLVNRDLMKAKEKLRKEPYSAGVFLGRVKKGVFYPSIALIDMIAEVSNKKIFVDDRAEWLFVCGRDLFPKSIVESNVDSGLALVQNMKDENLGLGKVEKKIIKNVLDKGKYLRIER